MKAAIVVPTIREASIRKFLAAWKQEFEKHEVIVVEDNPDRSFQMEGRNLTHFSWKDIDSSLGDKAWIVPRRTDCVRSYGLLMASRREVDMVITLDDDCYPISPGFVEGHWNRLSTPTSDVAWRSTGRGWTPRGVPYTKLARTSETALSHGMWTNIPDFDALTQLVASRESRPFETVDQVIARGFYFPMCGMNVAIKPKVLPAFYFLLMGKEWPYDRFGDIWCGVMVKKICDHLGMGAKSGPPLIEHQRASDVWVNLEKEGRGYKANEDFWVAVDSVRLTKDSFKGCYLELAEKLPLAGAYWDKLKEAMAVWASLFPS